MLTYRCEVNMRFSFDKYWSITKNKSLEIQLDIGKAEWDLFRFVLNAVEKAITLV